MTREGHRARECIYQFGPSIATGERERELKTAYVTARTQVASRRNDPRRPSDYHK